jgi:uncharacterized protein (TIGR02001 family)
MSIKTTTMGAAALLAAAVFASPAFADGLPGRGKVADAPMMPRTCTTAANVGLTSDYVFRGVSQSSENPAIQGGVDFTCGNWYAGVWGSSIDFGVEGTTEVDFFGGYKFTTGRLSWDVGVIYYAYPGINSNLDADYVELKLGVSGELWKGGTLGGTVFYSPEFSFNTGETWTVEATFSQALPKVAIFSPTFSATVGNVSFSDVVFLSTANADRDDNWTYWNAGLTLGFLEKWSLDLRYWDTDDNNASNFFGKSDERFVGTIKYTF